ncbi:MAG: hypothetical protein C4527_20630 [Candidatus Omnitrophota bacterium]|jgi:phosphatidylserine/phosphatidylglycerophosphate/cardiolipin synthase-like enzyme|nr:MAG: hypothetical protein C4527_20630 [Candidatus Omnitrophota bacterium]
MMKSENHLLQSIVAIARHIPPEMVFDICSRLEAIPNDSTFEQRKNIVKSITQPDLRNRMLQLFHDWEDSYTTLSPVGISLALKASTETNKNYKTQNIDLVWTGPNPPGCMYRQTYQVLIDLIRSSKASILIVTFVAYKIQEITAALIDAAKRNVKINFVIESIGKSDGKVLFDAIKAIGPELAKMSEVFVWPQEKRTTNPDGKYGSLHAKCAVIDKERAIVSSANLTEFALDINMEMGLLITGGDIPRKISNHFLKLIEMGILEKISEK